MQLILDIPDNFEKDFELDKFSECFRRTITDIDYAMSHDKLAMAGNYERETFEMLEKAFGKATVLDKQHGPLVDISQKVDVQLFDDEHEAFTEQSMTIEEYLDRYTDGYDEILVGA